MSARHAIRGSFKSCRIALAAVLMLSPVGFAADGGAPAGHSLCAAGEKVVFSCSVPNGKVVSLCASPDLSRDTGYLQYRFGRDTDSVEMQFPHSTHRADGTFKYLQEYFAKGGTTALSFWVGPFRYSVFRTTSAFGFNGAGIIVSKERKRVAYMRCDDRTIVTDDDRLADLPGLGMPEANGDISYIGAEPQ
jgi:hypothetical protein